MRDIPQREPPWLQSLAVPELLYNKILDKSKYPKVRKGYFGSQFEGLVHCDGEAQQ